MARVPLGGLLSRAANMCLSQACGGLGTHGMQVPQAAVRGPGLVSSWAGCLPDPVRQYQRREIMAENLVEKAIREAEEACQAAIASTPPAYRRFITLIPQSKQVGPRGSQQYANIRLPYMTVDGRVKMAMDEHRTSGARITIDTTFETLGDKTLCRAIVNSSLLGAAVGHDTVNFGGKGVDSTNPIPNAETSAIGRALGFLGYGLFGTGIASAEEVLAAQAIKPMAEEKPVPPFPEPASQKQMGLLYSLLKTVGIRDGDKRELIASAYPVGMLKSAATQMIDYVQSKKECPGPLRCAYIKFLIGKQGLDRLAVASGMDAVYGHHDPEKLSQKQFGELVSTLTEGPAEQEDVYEPGEPLKEVTAIEWVQLAKSICEACQFTVKDLESWAIPNFGSGQEQALNELPSESYHAIAAMDLDKIKAEVDAHRGVADEQHALTL